MATGAYEGGGIGGKIRRRPARASVTPYHRPVEAARGVRVPAVSGGNGWLSKVVDPASRFIASSASRLFSSVFRKRLPAPPQATPGQNLQSNQEACFTLTGQDHLSNQENGIARAGQNHQSNQEGIALTGQNLQSNQESPGITYLKPSSEILDSGAMDGNNLTSASDDKSISEFEQLLKHKTFTRAEFDHLTELLRSRTVESNVSYPAPNNVNKDALNVSAGELHGKFLHPGGSAAIPEEESASPAELAKAYMGARSLKGSPSPISLRSRAFHEGTAGASSEVYATKLSGVSLVPRSTMRTSGLPEVSENGYMTPKSRGRSAIYRMSRSPYFKASPSSKDVYAVPWSTYQTPPTSMVSSGRQALKRRSAVLDSEIGSVGPIRRIRQKAAMVSPSKETHPSHHENKGRDNGTHNDSVPSIPSQSTEMGRKILRQLDKLAPSPKEKSSDPKDFSRNEAPSKSTQVLSLGHEPRRIEDGGPSRSINVLTSSSLDLASSSSLLDIRESLSGKQDRMKEKYVSEHAVPQVLTSQYSGVDAIKSTSSVSLGKSDVDELPNSAAVPLGEKRGFQMIVPEDTLELDDDSNILREASIPVNVVVNKLEPKISGKRVESKIPEKKVVMYETTNAERAQMSLPKTLPLSSSILFSEADKKASVSPAHVDNTIGFTFNGASAPSTYSQPAPTPSIPGPSPDAPVKESEHDAGSGFTFGFKQFPTSTFPPSTTKSDMKAGTSNIGELNRLDGSTSDKGAEKRKTRDLSQSSENVVSSAALSSVTAPVFAFGSSTSPSLTNGSLNSSSPIFSFSAASVVPSSERPVSTLFSTSMAGLTSSSGLSTIPAVPVFPTVPAFQFGSSTSVGSQMTTLPSDKPVATNMETKAPKLPSFGIDSATNVGTSAVLNSGARSSTDLTTSYTFSSTANGSSAAATSSAISSMGSSLGASTVPTLFSSLAGGQSAPAPSLMFSSTGNSIFGFSASAHSSSSSSSVACNGSQTGVTFGTSTEAVFGNQSSKSGTGIQQLSESSVSQLSSSASPTFGLGSSSSGFGASPFGSATMVSQPFSSSSGFSFSASAGSSSSSTSSSSAQITTSLFSSASVSSTSSILPTTFGSNAAPSTVFTFGQSSSASGSSPFSYAAPSSSLFSFTAASTAVNSTPQHMFGMPTLNAGFGSGSLGNDQMNVEDSMADDNSQPVVPPFGQSGSSPATPIFGAPAIPSGGPSIFQFGGLQSPAPQGQSPFQASGNLEVPPGGGFSMGSLGGDKSGRRIVKVRRDKQRKK
ncbi:nuclear pore complex protein NUP1 isoform X2 [Typha angustifolia]|uniref:nuclear pore complex protein NUP1 isoform X2 n=1 Tax=Typha angustifolia TaxID=59011 RepID=UPI003C2F5C49